MLYEGNYNNQLDIFRSGKYYRSEKRDYQESYSAALFVAARLQVQQTDHSNDPMVAIKTYFTGKAFSCSHGYCFQIGFVEMKIQRVLENNTNPFTCSKSDGTESIIIPSENLKGQGKGLLLNFEYGAP